MSSFINSSSAGVGSASVAYTGAQNDTGSEKTVWTLTNVNLGTPVPGRIIIAAVSWRSYYNGALSAVTINGVSAPILVQNIVLESSNYFGLALVAATVPEGSRVDVVVTLAAAAVGADCRIFRAVNVISTTPVDTAGATGSSATVSADADTTAGGIAVVAARHTGAAAAVSGGGVVTDFSNTTLSTSNRITGGNAETVATASNVTFSATPVAGQSNIVVATFR